MSDATESQKELMKLGRQLWMLIIGSANIVGFTLLLWWVLYG